MSFALIILKSAFRNRMRTTLTAVGVAIAIVAFLFLRTFIAAWYAGADASAADRLITRNKISITESLPLSHVQKTKGVRGVADLSYANWFGAVYKDERDFFAQMAVDGETWFRLYPEFVVDKEAYDAFMADRSGAVIGSGLAKKYGWKVGDKFVLKGTIYPGDWEFTVRAIYQGRDKRTDLNQMFFHWKYLDERVQFNLKNTVGIVVVKVDGPGTEVGAAIDKLFENSLAETRTESEKAFQLSFIAMSSAIINAIEIVSGVVLMILMLILGNTLAMASRERTTEYAAMRAIGFRPSHIVRLVIGEGLVVGAMGATLGVLLATPILRALGELFVEMAGPFLSDFAPAPGAMALGAGFAVVGGVLASSIPAVRAGRLKIVDALRRIE